ncbi:MAG TPA: iron ABC transporter permease [Egibacteraceae bacterium]|nr:iron ABC transporter permease [Egibacteraceae bacterium]
MSKGAVAPSATAVAGRAPRRRLPGLLLVPTLVAAIATALPLAYLAVRAAGAGEEALRLLWRPATAEVLSNTVGLVAVVTAGAVLIGVPLAWLVTCTDLPGRRVWSVALSLPLVIPSYVAGFAYVAAFAPGGMLPRLLGPFGVQRLPDIYGLWGAAAALTLVSYPYVLLTVRGALMGMDRSLEDAARSLGSGKPAVFARITLPLLRPAIAAGALLVALYALSDFGAVSLLRFDSFTRAIHTAYRAGFDRTGAVVLALVLVALTGALLVIEARLRGGDAHHRTGPGARRTPPTARLGRWRWPAVVFCALVAGLGLGVPVVVLGYWLARGLAAGEPLRLAAETWAAAWHSVRASAMAAAASAALALPIGVLSVRYRRRSTILLERVTYLGYALPGIVVALSLVFFGARFAGPLYQTLALLVFAYVVLFLPQAVGAVRSSVLQISPSLEDAARTLGASGARVTAQVTVPLARPGLVAGGMLVFLTAMKELPATLLLGPTGQRTLATAVWNATSEAFFARAAAPALVLILVAGLPMAVLVARGFGPLSRSSS